MLHIPFHKTGENIRHKNPSMHKNTDKTQVFQTAVLSGK